MNFLALSLLDCVILRDVSRSGLDPLTGNWASAFKNDRNQIVPKMVKKKKTVMFLKSTMRDRGSTTSLGWYFLLIFSSPFVLGGYFFLTYLFIYS